MMTDLLIGQVVRFSEDEHRERLLWKLPEGRGGWFIDIDDDRAAPILRIRSEVEDLLAEGLLALSQDPWSLTGEALSETQRLRCDEAWEAIRPLTLAQPEIFNPRSRAALVQKRVVETGITRQRLYRLLRRWWRRGMTISALTPDYARSGAPGKPKPEGTRKRGKPAHIGPVGMNVDEEVRAAFRAVVTTYFAKNRKIDVAACYHQCLKDHFSDLRLDEETGRQELVLREAHPSLWQFRYWLEQDNDLFALARKRRTPRVYDKDNRAILGTSTAETLGPGSRYQIDATIADVYLVSRFDRTKIIGRPVVYVVIDVFSRMIAGLYVGLEGPSWVGAMTALANAASPKAEWCRSFGVEISEADWPCRSLPTALLADRGEMLGSAAETLVQRFGLRLENAAPYRADWKGIVERRFGLLHSAFKPYVPGFVEPDFQERGARDYRLDATLDLEQFTAVLIHCVLHENNEHPIDSYPRDPAMIAEGVNPIPIELWEWGVQRRTGLQRAFPEDLLKLTLLPSDEATVTAQGIRFYGCYYSCDRAIREHWFEKARQTRSWKIPISYEPRLMDRIWLRDPKGRGEPFLPCSLTERSAGMRGMSLWEIDQLRKEDRRQRAALTPRRRQGRINLNEEIERIAALAASARPEDPRSKAERLRDIRGNRAEERAANRAQEAFRPHLEQGEPAQVLPFKGEPKPAKGNYDFPDIMQARKHLEREKEKGGDDDG
ncbi:Mu transposase C-terminal domain-containing protein [Neomegalonema perideroedes]|uniref:Mu transposase C-terminal domain-containing protein n=1 Tax=Neomegalonema perideroedes TaxID=217219 RepID=UPI00036A8C87|nr:Mu transposase C-terminal domain-containing protein [Neomegalonema perideroedes]